MNFFTKNPNLNYLFGGCGLGVWGGGVGWGGLGRWTNRPIPICPFNFFEVGGTTMNKCTSYGPDKLN